MAAPWPTLGQYWGDSLTHPMLITAFSHFQPEGHQEPHNEVGSLSLTTCLVGFEPGTFQFWLIHLNPLGHSPPSDCFIEQVWAGLTLSAYTYNYQPTVITVRCK